MNECSKQRQKTVEVLQKLSFKELQWILRNKGKPKYRKRIIRRYSQGMRRHLTKELIEAELTERMLTGAPRDGLFKLIKLKLKELCIVV